MSGKIPDSKPVDPNEVQSYMNQLSEQAGISSTENKPGAQKTVDDLIAGMKDPEPATPAKKPEADRNVGQKVAKAPVTKTTTPKKASPSVKFEHGKGVFVGEMQLMTVAEFRTHFAEAKALKTKEEKKNFAVRLVGPDKRSYKVSYALMISLAKEMIAAAEKAKAAQKAEAAKKAAAQKTSDTDSFDLSESGDIFGEDDLEPVDDGAYSLAPEVVTDKKSAQPIPPDLASQQATPVKAAPVKGNAALLNAFRGGLTIYGKWEKKTLKQKVDTARQTALTTNPIKNSIARLTSLEFNPAVILSESNLKRINKLKGQISALVKADSLNDLKKSSRLFKSTAAKLFPGYNEDKAKAVTDEKVRDYAIASFLVSFDVVHKVLASTKKNLQLERTALENFNKSIKLLGELKADAHADQLAKKNLS